nr:hypothetical protein [Propionibacterium sp.]
MYRRVPEGTMVEWTGHIVSTGRLTRFLGPVMGRFFQWGVARDFAMLARHAERTSSDRR